jgi:quercetin dioxygenase-like cupin family protein
MNRPGLPSRITFSYTSFFGALAAAAFLGACRDGSDAVAPQSIDIKGAEPVFTASSGSTSTLLGRATFSDPADPVFKVKRITGDWHMELKSTPGFDLAIQNIVFQPGSQSGWHSHPGPVFIQVVSGTMTFYESDDPTCTPTVRTAGQGFLDYGDHPHLARNETASVAVNVVTYFAPPGAALRIDAPRPGNCSF